MLGGYRNDKTWFGAQTSYKKIGPIRSTCWVGGGTKIIRLGSASRPRGVTEQTTLIRSPSRLNGPGSSVGISNGYGIDGPGIESRLGRDFPHLSRPALGPTQPPVQRRVKSGRGVTLTPHPLLEP